MKVSQPPLEARRVSVTVWQITLDGDHRWRTGCRERNLADLLQTCRASQKKDEHADHVCCLMPGTTKAHSCELEKWIVQCIVFLQEGLVTRLSYHFSRVWFEKESTILLVFDYFELSPWLSLICCPFFYPYLRSTSGYKLHKRKSSLQYRT